MCRIGPGATLTPLLQAGLDDVRRRGLDGIVCGHIHRAALVQRDGLVYANDGDWVESLTALVEHHDGRLEILDFGRQRVGLGAGPGPRPEADPGPRWPPAVQPVITAFETSGGTCRCGSP